MNNIAFTVWIKFEDNIKKEESLKEIAGNIMEGMINQVNGMGLAPEDEETFTRGISISHRGTELINYEF